MGFDVEEYIKSKKQKNSTSSEQKTQSFDVEAYVKSKNIDSVAENLTNRFNSWLESSSNYAWNYKNKTRGKSFDYTDSYVSDSADWLSEITKQKSALDAEREWIASTINSYSDFFDAEWRENALKALEEGSSANDSVFKAAEEYNKYWTSFESEDAFNKWASYERERQKKLTTNLDDLKVSVADLESKYEYSKKLEDELNQVELSLKYASHGGIDIGKAKQRKEELLSLINEAGSASVWFEQLSSKRAFYLEAEYMQGKASLEDVTSKPDFEKYVQIGADASNPDWISAHAPLDIGGWTPFGDGKDIGNMVTFAESNADEVLKVAGQALRGGGKQSELVTMVDLINQYMRDDEKKIYNYYVGKGDTKSAEAYLKYLTPDLEQRKAAGVREDIDGNLFLSTIVALSAGIDQSVTGFENLGNVIFNGGEEEYTPPTYSQMLSAGVREDVAEKSGVVGTTIFDLAQTTGNMLPSILTSTIVGAIPGLQGAAPVIGTAMMGGSAAGNAYTEMINLGYSDGQAKAYAAMTGASEALLSYALGGISKLGGKLSGKTITAIASGVDNAIGRIAIKMGGNMLSEFTEEGLQEVLTPFFENLATGTNINSLDDINWGDVAYSGLLGALSAGFLETGGTISSDIATTKSGKEFMKTGKDAGQNLANFAKNTFSADTVAYKIANKVNENTGAYTIGTLLQEANATLSEQNLSEIENGLIERGLAKSDAKKLARQYQAFLNGEMSFSDEQIKVLENTEPLSDILRKNIIGANTTVYQRTRDFNDVVNPTKESESKAGTAPYSKEFIDSLEYSAEQNGLSVGNRALRDLAREKFSVSESDNTTANKFVSEGKFKASEDGKTIVTETSEEVTPVKIVSTEGDLKVELKGGKVVEASKLSFSTDSEAIAYEMVAKMGVSVDTANALVNAFKTVDNGQMVMGDVPLAYQYGKIGYKEGLANVDLTDTQKQYVYDLGRADAEIETKAEQEKVTTNVKTRKGSGQVRFEKGAKAKSPAQKKAVNLATHLAKAIGIDIVFYDATIEGTYGSDSNGYFDERTNTIHLDLQNSNDDAKTIAFTMSHELVHFIKKWSPAKFKVFADFLMEQYMADSNTSNLLQKKMDALGTTDIDLAYEELIADACETMLLDSNAVVKLMELRKSDLDLFEKIKLHILQLLNKIRAEYKRLGLAPTSDEAKALLKMEDVLSKLHEMFEEAAVDATQNYQAAESLDMKIVKERGYTPSDEKIANDDGIKKQVKKNKENFVEDKYFKSQMQRWDSLSLGSYVKVGEILEDHPLVKVGMPQGIIRYDVAKLNKNMEKHKFLNIDLLHAIPDIIANPIAISEYSQANTVNVFGDVFVGDSPMMVAVTISKDRSGADISKVRTYNARRDVGTLITDDTVLYLNEDKKRTRKWFQANGKPVPLGETKFGFIRSISQNVPNVKKQLKKSSDKDYLDAVERGDTETAQRMVDEAAKEAGYDSPKLYHGTNRFGFTKFDTSRGHGFIYGSTKSVVAANYGGRDNYAFTRQIGRKYISTDSPEYWLDPTKAIIQNAESVLGTKYKVLDDTTRQALRKDVFKQAENVANKLDELYADLNLPYDIDNDLSWVMDVFYTIRENDSEFFSDDTDYKNQWVSSLQGTVKHYNESYPNLRGYLGEHLNEFDDDRKKFARFLMSYDLTDTAIDIEYKYLRAANPTNEVQYVNVQTNQNIVTREQLQDIIDKAKDIGVYSLYGNVGNKPLIVDADGRDWVLLKVPEMGDDKYHSTDVVAEWAKDNGYSSVIVKNVYDGGEKADDYIFFDSNQVKSADPITYDDNGNVIPLSERFKSENNDIRFQKKKGSDRILMGSLFSGGGTLEAGLTYQMLDKQFGVEYDGKIASVYADNHGDHIQVGRVEDFDISKYDDIFYLHASPVCHNFSAAKHGAKELQMDIDSAKATAKHLETAMPQVFTVENAPGYRKSQSLKIITDKLTELGYKWDVDVYNSADYGSATSRNRVILRAVRDGELPPKPSKQERTNSWDKVTRDLWDTLPKSNLRPSFISAIENTPKLPILDANGKVNVNKPLLILTTTSGHMVTYCWEGEICPTLTTKCGEAKLVMPDGNIYAVTPEFMGRIQGLPNDYKYPKEKTRAFTIIGNGIPTHLTKAVIGGVLDSAYEQTHDGRILFQKKMPTNRTLLANALDSIAQNDIEKNKLTQYKKKIALIEAEQAKLSAVRQEANDIRFKKGRTPDETKRMKDLDFEANQTANRINTYDRQLLNLESTEALKNVLTREKELARKKEAQKGKEALAAYKERAANTQRELMTRYQESRKNAIEGRHKTEMKHKIKKVVSDLNNLLLNPTKDQHVPIGLQFVVADALDAINMDTMNAGERVAYYNDLIAKSSDSDEIATLTKKRDFFEYRDASFQSRITALKNAYAEFKESDDPLIRSAHDDAIENLIRNTADEVGNKSLKNMSLDQLEAVYDMYKAILSTVRNSNKMFKEGRQATVTENSEAVKTEVREVGGHKDRVLKLAKFFKSFGWTMLKPVTAMKVIGSDTFAKLFDNVRAGEDTWAVDVNEAKQFFDDTADKYGYKSWNFKKKFSFMDSAGHSFSLTLEQIMSLYAYSKREQADQHLEFGGFIFDDAIEITEKNKLGIPLKYEVNDANPYRLRKEDLLTVTNALDEKQKGFIDEMQTYLSDVMGAKGNEVSLALYDIKLYKEKNYFPLKTSRYFREFDPEKAGTPKIKNSGFSKKTVPQAGNPIVLSNFMDVWAGHVNDMSMYHAFVLPLEDFMRVYNYSSTAGGYDSVQQYIKNAYGSQANQYIERLVDDLNGGARVDSSAGVINKGLSLFKKASVFASASVVIQQPSAIARALAYINPKYFATSAPSAVNFANHKKLWEEVKKYAPVAVIKEMGYFDTGMGKSTVEWIKGDQTIKDKVDDFLSKAPAMADELSWTYIWEAVKKETADKSGLAVGSEEFLKKAGERFTEVITNTQVYDSVLSRSQAMRSKDTGMKMATAFMAEPLTTVNMMVDGILQGKRGNKKFTAATVGAVSASIILNSILVSIVYGARDDDEDETYAEKYVGSLTTELVDGFNPLTYIPFVKDIWSIAQGFDVERSDMSVINKLWESVEGLFNENKSGLDKVLDVSGSLASLFGIPLKNLIRDGKAMYNVTKTIMSGTPTTKAGLAKSAGDALRDSVPLLGRFSKEKSDSDLLYEAILDGDAKQIERVKKRFKDQKAIDSALRKALRDYDPRIKDAAKARMVGDIAEYKRIAEEIIAEGNFSQDVVVGAINAEISALDKEKPTVEEPPAPDKETSIYKADDINLALASGDLELAKEIINDLLDTKVANGMEEDKAKSSVKSSITSYWKPLYKEAYKKGDTEEMKRIREILRDTELYGRPSEILETCKRWLKDSE